MTDFLGFIGGLLALILFGVGFVTAVKTVFRPADTHLTQAYYLGCLRGTEPTEYLSEECKKLSDAFKAGLEGE